MPGAGPQVVITDLGIMKPAPGSQELTLVARYEHSNIDSIRLSTGWPLAIAESVDVIPAPSARELKVLRDLHDRTRVAHARPVRKKRTRTVASP
jgi:glutaconate CoA-transferase, subunit B